jgi:hypothetical protein
MLSSSLIVLDSNEYIIGLTVPGSDSTRLLDILAETGSDCIYTVAVPLMVQLETVSNLGQHHAKRFFRLVNMPPWQGVYYQLPPSKLLRKYLSLLPEEDSHIAAFAEWVKAGYLVSENRHFLHRLQTDAFRVVDAGGMLVVLSSVGAD